MKHILICLLLAHAGYAQKFDYATDLQRIGIENRSPASLLNYETLKKAFIDHGEDFSQHQALALMIGQVTREDYFPLDSDIDMNLAYRNAEHFPSDTIYKYAPEYMEWNPTNLSLHYGLWKTFEKDGKKAEAEKYKKRFNLLCETILSTGDGKERPYFVVFITDAWALTELYQGNSILIKGTGMSEEGHTLEILDILNDKETKEQHFIIEHVTNKIILNIPVPEKE